ncbi:hypothetical protein B9K06_12630 [Bacillus sp. OG2]|nr:hypothetical protein B9K06_12630 [Bacillus sp. OG2]
MDPFEFEWFIKEMFELLGYHATVTKKTNDGGKDIILRKNDQRSLVECKRYNTPKVTRPDIQKFHSAIIDYKATKGYFVTTGDFTKPAIEYCKDKKIELISGKELVILLEEVMNCNEKVEIKQE